MEDGHFLFIYTTFSIFMVDQIIISRQFIFSLSTAASNAFNQNKTKRTWFVSRQEVKRIHYMLFFFFILSKHFDVLRYLHLFTKPIQQYVASARSKRKIGFIAKRPLCFALMFPLQWCSFVARKEHDQKIYLIGTSLIDNHYDLSSITFRRPSCDEMSWDCENRESPWLIRTDLLQVLHTCPC